jgi:hypothetical protein
MVDRGAFREAVRRATSGLSVQQVAQWTGLDPACIAEMRGSGVPPKGEALLRFAERLELSARAREELYRAAGWIDREMPLADVEMELSKDVESPPAYRIYHTVPPGENLASNWYAGRGRDGSARWSPDEKLAFAFADEAEAIRELQRLRRQLPALSPSLVISNRR